MRREVAKLEAEALGKFSSCLGERLARRVRPSLRAQANANHTELRVTYFRQIIANPDQITCLSCDENAGEYMKLRIDKHSPFGHLPRDPNVYLLFCGEPACQKRLDALADAIALPADNAAEVRSNLGV